MEYGRCVSFCLQIDVHTHRCGSKCMIITPQKYNMHTFVIFQYYFSVVTVEQTLQSCFIFMKMMLHLISIQVQYGSSGDVHPTVNRGSTTRRLPLWYHHPFGYKYVNDDVMVCLYFAHCWPFVWGIHSPGHRWIPLRNGLYCESLVFCCYCCQHEQANEQIVEY